MQQLNEFQSAKLLRFWIADFGIPGNKGFFEESELSLAINSQKSIKPDGGGIWI